VQMLQADSTLSLQVNSLIRIVAAAVSVSLVAAAGVLLIEAQSQPRPMLQLPATLLTVALGGIALYASSLAVEGRRLMAFGVWAACLVLLVLMPLLQALPIRYDTPALLDLKALAPPVWPYSLAIPLLLFLLLEVSLPARKTNGTSNLFLLLGLLSAIMILFFGAALIGSVANRSTLVLVPTSIFLSVLIPIGLGGLLVVATVLPRKGFTMLGVALLVATGLGVEWISTWSYGGPHFLGEAAQIPYPRFPMLPVLAGTIPGILATGAGLLAAWEVYIRDQEADTAEPLSGKELSV
jgi:hypothetical protein